MSTIKINAERALKALEEAVAERGAEYRYPAVDRPDERCMYAYNGAPDCGVGLALSKAGVPLEALDALDDNGVVIDGHQAIKVLSDFDVELTVAASQVLGDFQTKQDVAWTWGAALDRARRERAETLYLPDGE